MKIKQTRRTNFLWDQTGKWDIDLNLNNQYFYFLPFFPLKKYRIHLIYNTHGKKNIKEKKRPYQFNRFFSSPSSFFLTIIISFTTHAQFTLNPYIPHKVITKIYWQSLEIVYQKEKKKTFLNKIKIRNKRRKKM